jgi:6-phosphofructokinase 1
VLGSSRGGFELEKILNFLRDKKISQLYVIGGDGTHRGAFAIHEGCMERGFNVAVAGIPKTIDNDVDYIDHSFGFSSAVEAAQVAIQAAKTEAVCNLPNGIGIVKLMGRSAGFIAAHATMASCDVDLCEDGCLPHLKRRVQEQGYAVVVVAEGAGEEVLGVSAETDASGNKKLPAIGEFMKKSVEDYFKKHGETATVKYIDPSYTVRSVPANAADSLYCMQLAQNAVHGAMAGFTGFSIGLCNNRMVFLPIPELVATSPRCMNPRGRTWERVLSLTRQPNTVPPLKKGEQYSFDSHAPMLR